MGHQQFFCHQFGKTQHTKSFSEGFRLSLYQFHILLAQSRFVEIFGMGLEAIYSMPGNVSVSFPAQVLKYIFHTNHFTYENIWRVNLTTKTRPFKENPYPCFKSWHTNILNILSIYNVSSTSLGNNLKVHLQVDNFLVILIPPSSNCRVHRYRFSLCTYYKSDFKSLNDHIKHHCN